MRWNNEFLAPTLALLIFSAMVPTPSAASDTSVCAPILDLTDDSPESEEEICIHITMEEVQPVQEVPEFEPRHNNLIVVHEAKLDVPPFIEDQDFYAVENSCSIVEDTIEALGGESTCTPTDRSHQPIILEPVDDIIELCLYGLEITVERNMGPPLGGSAHLPASAVAPCGL